MYLSPCITGYLGRLSLAMDKLTAQRVSREAIDIGKVINFTETCTTYKGRRVFLSGFT